MDIFWFMVAIAAWLSPYWWVKKIDKETNNGLLFVLIVTAIVAFFAESIWFSLMYLLGGINFIIAYCREYVDWDFDEIFSSSSSSHSSSSHSVSRRVSNSSWSQTTEEDVAGTQTTYAQDEALKEFWENVESTKRDPEKIDEIYDHDGYIDYDKVNEANEEMRAEISGRVE